MGLQSCGRTGQAPDPATAGKTGGRYTAAGCHPVLSRANPKVQEAGPADRGQVSPKEGKAADRCTAVGFRPASTQATPKGPMRMEAADPAGRGQLSPKAQ